MGEKSALGVFICPFCIFANYNSGPAVLTLAGDRLLDGTWFVVFVRLFVRVHLVCFAVISGLAALILADRRCGLFC